MDATLSKESLEKIRSIFREEFEAKVKSLEAQVQCLTKRLIDMENRDRRMNIIAYNVNEEGDESEEKCEKVFVEAVKKFSGVNIEANDLVRLHRLGRKKNGTNRPIIAKFISDRVRTKILRASRAMAKANGSRPSLAEDFAQETRLARKKLQPLLTEAYKKGTKAFFNVERAIVGKKVFIYNAELDRVEEEQPYFSFGDAQIERRNRGAKNLLSPSSLSQVGPPSASKQSKTNFTDEN